MHIFKFTHLQIENSAYWIGINTKIILKIILICALTWLEPLRQWVKTANHIGKLANSDSDYKDLSSALQKVGSNPILKDKKIVFEWLPPFDILAKDRELDTEKAKNPARAGFKKREEKNETSLLVPGGGLEPPHLAAYAPQTYLSTNSNIRAKKKNS